MSQRQIRPCHKCGELGGWVEHWIVRQEQMFTPDGTADSCEHYHDRGGKTKYCAQCGEEAMGQIERLRRELSHS